jgi:hypothetical protein
VVSVYLPVVAKQRLGEYIPTAKENCWRLRFVCFQRRIRGGSVGLYIPLSLLSNGSVNTFSRHFF